MVENDAVDAIRKLIDEGRFQEAVDECRALLFDDPQSPEVLALLREASAAIESDAPAARPGGSSGEEPEDEDLASKLAREFGEEEEQGADEADAGASSLSDDDKERVDALVREGESAMAEGKYQQAIDVWSRIYIIDLNNTKAQKLVEKARIALEEEQRKWDELIQEGDDLLGKREYDAALEKFRKVLEASPNHGDALDGIERVEQARREESEKADKSKQMMAKAAKLFRDGQVSEAIYTWEKVLEIEPGNDRARKFLAEARSKMGEPVTGADQYAVGTPPPRASKAAPASSSSSELLSAAYQSSDEALPPVVVAKGRLPLFIGISLAAAIIVAGAVYIGLSRGESDEGDDVDEAPVEGQKTDVPAAPVEDVTPPVLDAATAAAFDKQLDKNPGYIEARKAFAEGRYEEAVGLYKTVATEAPDNQLVTQQIHRSLYNAGVMALRAGNVAKAIEHWSAAIQMEPTDTVTKRHLEAARRYADKAPDDRLRWYAQLAPLRK